MQRAYIPDFELVSVDELILFCLIPNHNMVIKLVNIMALRLNIT
jgi:hypothetical protein